VGDKRDQGKPCRRCRAMKKAPGHIRAKQQYRQQVERDRTKYHRKTPEDPVELFD
jgi:hypothetical protein